MNYIQQAYKGNNQWYHWIFTLILVFFGWQIIGVFPLTGVAISYSSDMNEFANAAQNNFMTLEIDKNLFLFLIIISFISGLLTLILGVKYIHRRTFKSLVTSRKLIDWKRFWFAFLFWGFISVIMIMIDYQSSTENYVFNFELKPFLILVAIAVIFVPLQTSFEEYLFRGYLMQGIGVICKNKWVPLIVTSVLFGMLHIANPEIDKLGYILLVHYIGTGFFLGIITLMDEGLELALGFHAANNLFTALLVTADWTAFQTNSIFRDISDPDIGSFEIFSSVLIIYPILIFIFSKVYKWTDWKNRLIGSVTKDA